MHLNLLIKIAFKSKSIAFRYKIKNKMTDMKKEEFSKRMGMVIYLREEKKEEYERLHSQVWPQVKARLTESNMRNFTIYHCKELGVLFAHLEYIGDDLDEDMKKIGDDPVTREWWKVN